MDLRSKLRRAFKSSESSLAHRDTQKIPESCILFSNPNDAIIDIVFVHGFGGDRLGTWTSGGVCWPESFLKSKLERARIISFGYEATISRLLPSAIDGPASISKCALELLRSLCDLRADVCQRERALIFVVHSLGSTIVKEVLCHSTAAPPQDETAVFIARSCTGILFLGAAHSETQGENFGQIATKAALAVQPSLEPEILRTLSERSTILKFDRINNAFLKFMNSKTDAVVKAITFYEAESSTGKVVIKRESARMDSPNHHLRCLASNHNDMCRFNHSDDPIYVEISGVISEFYDSMSLPQRIGCEVVHDCQHVSLDIVFVHSLGCDHHNTWICDGTYWPKELLPRHLPFARIIAYHYQTDFAAFLKDDQTVLYDQARQFLLSLIHFRANLSSRQSPTRPIIFIAHATGGVLVKQVLNISHLATGQAAMRAIAIETRGILFFATPHRSDGGDSVGEIIAQSVSAMFPDLIPSVAKAIAQDPALDDINTAFQDFLDKREHKVHIISFHERKLLFPTPIITRSSVTLSAQQHIAQVPGSHVTLGQFQKVEKYRYVIKQIQIATGEPSPGSGYVNKWLKESEPATFLATLLGNVKTPVALPDDPSAWLEASMMQFQNAAQKILKIFSNEELASMTNTNTRIYLRLFAYTLAYTKLCASDGLRDSLNAQQCVWSQRDLITSLISHRSICDALLGFLDRNNAWKSPSVSPAHVQNLLKIDLMGIIALTLEILCDPQRKESLLDQSGDVAQATLDHLQQLLDLSEFGGRTSSLIVAAISILAKRCGRDLKQRHLHTQGTESDHTQVGSGIQGQFPGFLSSSTDAHPGSQTQSIITAIDTPLTSNVLGSNRTRDSVSVGDIIIVVMGLVGAGKSSFINTALGRYAAVTGHGVELCTRDVRPFRSHYPDGGEGNIVLVDTPGFDSDSVQDEDSLAKVSQWLTKSFKKGIVPTRILYLHRISKIMSDSSLRILAMFEKLCGDDCLQNVTLVTTMWDGENEQACLQRQLDLEQTCWSSMIQSGSRVLRFHDTNESAWDIIGQPPGRNLPLLIQREMVIQRKRVSDTSAGLILSRPKPILRKLATSLKSSPSGSSYSELDADLGSIGTGFQLQPRDRRAFLYDLHLSRYHTGSLSTCFLMSSIRSEADLQLQVTGLASTILVLELVADIADVIPITGLKDAISMTLRAAKMIAGMKSVKADLVWAVYNAGRLLVMLYGRARTRLMLDLTQRTLNNLIGDITKVHQIVATTERCSRLRALMLPVKVESVTQCHSRIQFAINVFEVQSALDIREVLARLEGEASRSESYEQNHNCHVVFLHMVPANNKYDD